MGKISRIQLRGISRSPSDRMTEDGGVAESLNVQLNDSEIAPSFIPEDVTANLGIAENVDATKMFIHKNIGYTNVIAQENDEIYAYINGERYRLFTLKSHKVAEISAVGNILIITTGEEIAYFLWRNNEYALIGDQLPVPRIQIEAIGNDDEVFQGATTDKIYLDASNAVAGRIAIATFNKTIWKKAAKGIAEIEDQNTYLQEVNRDLWAGIQQLKEKIGKWGYFSCPRLVRYAVRLYDGTYVHHSVPVLVGPGAKEWVSVTGSKTSTSQIVSSLNYTINLYYKAIARLIEWKVEGWEDIIAGVDIFISSDITFPMIGQEFETCEDGGGKIYFKGHNESFELTKQEVLSKVNFYRIESIAVNNLQGLKDGIDLHRNNDVEKEETLVLKERLTSDYMTSHRVIPSSMNIFNNRLLINASKVELPQPYSLLNGLFSDVNAVNQDPSKYSSPKAYQMRFHIRRNNGEEYTIMARSPEGTYDLITPFVTNGAPSQLETTFYARPMAWIAYPDPNCYGVEIYLGAGDVEWIDMYQHPALSCSYAFLGLETFWENGGQVAGDQQYDYEENTSYDVSNQIMLSALSNPFVFPASQRYTLQARVLGTAIATTALSQGQFGQFPLYVFTEDGIWAMETAADGSFVTSKPLSRDVCINPDSITSIDNAVIFVTDKGVMLLQGSQVVNISPNMNGRHYQIENSVRTIIENQDFFCDLLPALSDNTHFLTFVKGATVAYDYAGRRLIFIKKDEKYQYVYKLDTQTWHKGAYGIKLVAPINSYPECLVQGAENAVLKKLWVTRYESQNSWREIATDLRGSFDFLSMDELELFLTEETGLDVTGWDDLAIDIIWDTLADYRVSIEQREESILASRIYNFSTVLDTENTQPVGKGVIATRPFDLGEPDVFKTITDIRIRGQFPKGAVKFILLGSNDGINFATVSTLRGRAWKLFRMVILADLAPTERISWVDIMYDTKFTNKLR